jgi:hypothetical protein
MNKQAKPVLAGVVAVVAVLVAALLQVSRVQPVQPSSLVNRLAVVPDRPVQAQRPRLVLPFLPPMFGH